MPGKMTVLDRLIGEGRINKSPFGNAKYAVDELSFPAIREMDGKLVGGTARKMTPEREVYQKGIDARIASRHEPAIQKRADAYALKDQYENEWRDAVEEAKSDMADDWASTLDYQDFDEVNPEILENVELPSRNLRDFWPETARNPDEIYSDFDAAQDAYYAAKDAEMELFTPSDDGKQRTVFLSEALLPRRSADRRGAERKSYGDLKAVVKVDVLCYTVTREYDEYDGKGTMLTWVENIGVF